MKTAAQLAAEILSTQAHLERLLQDRTKVEEAEARLSPQQMLAVRMHEAMCRHNHGDGCSWHYEINRDGLHAWHGDHVGWLTKAGVFAKYCADKEIPLDVASELMEVIAKL